MLKKLYCVGWIIAVATISSTTIHAQDLLDGLLDKEAPVFHPTIAATPQSGSAALTYYFTHSKVADLEASVWIQDLGSNLMTQSSKRMVRGLRSVGNRQMDTLTLTGLVPGHFYALGVDYRYPNSLTRKFNNRVLLESYHYQGSLQARSAPSTEPVTETTTTPCINPDLFVKIDPAGYCRALNRPAILIRCDNCQGTNWEFSVEARTEYSQWRPLRSDGMAHTATGISPRTEPLCMLPPDNYYFRVLAWGENCKTPTINTIGTAVRIGDGVSVVPPSELGYDEPPSPPSYQDQVPESITVPESCGTRANASLEGNRIVGNVSLPLGGECEDWDAHIMLSYVHPGHRDINLDALKLYAGLEMPFQIELDQRDLQRGIHTLQATVYISRPDLPRPVSTETFWIRAEQGADNRTATQPTFNPGNTTARTSESIEVTEYEVLGTDAPTLEGTITNSGTTWDGDFSIDETLYEDQADPLQVTATDPNCTPIQSLQLVASPTQPDQPLFVSWMSPRCCQESGCNYIVWGGPTPQQVSLLVSGNKSGSTVSELIPASMAGAQYFEVVVRTTNGTRKAAYVPGRGPIYGLEEVLAYRDQFQPQKSDPVVGIKSGGSTSVGGGLADRKPGTVTSYSDTGIASWNQKPRMPLSKFRPCRYARKTLLEAEQPIRPGDDIEITYEFAEKDHQFTLYHQPLGSTEWFVAAGTQELQAYPDFDIEVEPYHAGRYLVLVYKPSKNWGCLSAAKNKALEVNIAQ